MPPPVKKPLAKSNKLLVEKICKEISICLQSLESPLVEDSDVLSKKQLAKFLESQGYSDYMTTQELVEQIWAIFILHEEPGINLRALRTLVLTIANISQTWMFLKPNEEKKAGFFKYESQKEFDRVFKLFGYLARNKE